LCDRQIAEHFEFKLKNKIITAPLAGISDRPFRDLHSEFLPGLLYSELISAEALIRKNQKTLKMLDDACGSDYPVTVQIFGAEPGQFKNAIEYIQTHYNPFAIDINMGCPVKKIVKNGAGAALMKKPELIKKILETICKIAKLRITIKIRLGWNNDSINYLEIAKIAENTNVSAIALHCRTAVQMYSGKGDWHYVKILKDNCKLPIIGNGDILNYDDYLEKSRFCDYVMIGRGLLYNPFLIKEILSAGEYKHNITDLKNIMKKHLKLLVDYYGEIIGVKHFRKFFGWYVKSIANAKKFREAGFRVSKFQDFVLLIEEIYTPTFPDN